MGNGQPTTRPSHLSCRLACPVGTHAGGYVGLVAQGRDREAYRLIRARNPFASVCGRVCAHPCESACRRGSLDEPLRIRALKRFVTSRFGVEAGRDFEEIAADVEAPRPRAEPGGRVAIVGAGPAGLACAHDLALMGHRVAVFDAAEHTGGMMRRGIPAYRLPRELLDREIDFVRWLGVDLELGRELGRDLALADLRRDHDAVFLAPGCRRGRTLDLPGVDAGGVMTAIDFLARVNLGHGAPVGRRIVVVGGGNVAFDAARTARRLEGGPASLSQLARDTLGVAAGLGDREVTLVAVESRESLVADLEELEEARAERISVRFGLLPVGFVHEDGGLCAARFQPVVRAFDDDGRFAPVVADAPEQRIECDTVVLAVGQIADLAFLDEEVARTPAGFVRVDRATLATSVDGIYAGGDAAFGPRNLIDAIADGRRAAAAIDTRITGRTDAPVREVERILGTLGYDHPFARGDYEVIPRHDLPVVEVRRRTLTVEVERELDDAAARHEAQRCLHCWVDTVFDLRELDGTMCIECGGCVDVCPEQCIDLRAILGPGGNGRWRREDGTDLDATSGDPDAVLLKDETRCIRCGLCARRCPVGAITMRARDLEHESPLVRLADRTI